MQVELPLYPVGAKYALAAPGTTNYIFSGNNTTPNFTAKENTVTVRVTVNLNTSGIFYVVMSNGTTTTTHALNGGTALTAGALYTFSFEARSAYTYDFKLGTDGIVNLLLVSEVAGGIN